MPATPGYPSCKPLPAPIKQKLTERKITGMVKAEDYDRKQFGMTFKKERTR